jgi:hypothetical protein
MRFAEEKQALMPPEMSGQLLKLSPALFGGYQDRFFHLKNKKIKWFKT